MHISIIVAMDSNQVIGKEGGLPWRLSSDLKHFKEITMGKPIIMGRKTHESIGRPLPGRENVVVTRDKQYQAEGCKVISHLGALKNDYKDEKEIMIIGGAQLYRHALEYANYLYLTEVHAEVEGDVFFPEYDKTKWREIKRENFKTDKKNEFDYSFVILERIKSFPSQ